MPRDLPAQPARPWGDVAVLTIDRVSTAVEGMHQAIAVPWFRLGGSAGGRLGELYATATAGVYGTIRMIAHGAGTMSNLVQGDARTQSSRRSDAVQAFANALWGDELERRSSPMAIDMAVHSGDGAAVPLDPASLSTAFPTASGRLVVLLHGLGQTERCFMGSDGSTGLTGALESTLSTPVLVRYNSGRSVAANGKALAGLLREVAEHWPVRQ